MCQGGRGGRGDDVGRMECGEKNECMKFQCFIDFNPRPPSPPPGILTGNVRQEMDGRVFALPFRDDTPMEASNTQLSG